MQMNRQLQVQLHSSQEQLLQVQRECAADLADSRRQHAADMAELRALFEGGAPAELSPAGWRRRPTRSPSSIRGQGAASLTTAAKLARDIRALVTPVAALPTSVEPRSAARAIAEPSATSRRLTDGR